MNLLFYPCPVKPCKKSVKKYRFSLPMETFLLYNKSVV